MNPLGFQPFNAPVSPAPLPPPRHRLPAPQELQQAEEKGECPPPPAPRKNLLREAQFLSRDPFHAWQYIDIVYQSPQVANIKDAKYILIAECHELGMRIHQSRAIDQCVIPGSILVVEGFSALSEVTGEKREETLNRLHISKYARRMITGIIGWDRSNHVAEPYGCCDAKDSEGSPTIFTFDDKRLSLRARWDLLEEAILEIGLAPPNYLEEDLAVAEEWLLETVKRLTEEIHETFPARTDDMTHTLKTIEERRLQGEIKGKIILIAGRLHLKEKKTANDPEYDPRYSLKSLYDVLPSLPAVIISSNIDTPEHDIEKLLYVRDLQNSGSVDF